MFDNCMEQEENAVPNKLKDMKKMMYKYRHELPTTKSRGTDQQPNDENNECYDGKSRKFGRSNAKSGIDGNRIAL